MVLRMTRPTRRRGSSFSQFRVRVPSDLKKTARGRRVVFRFPDEVSESTIVVSATFRRDDIAFSLRTQDPVVAKARTALALAQLDQFYTALRNGPRRLTKKQIVALAGLAYRGFADGGEDDPGPAQVWAEVLDANRAASQGQFGNAYLMIGGEEERRRASMEARFGYIADALLDTQGVLTDASSRWALVEELGRSLSQAAQKLQRNADGDFKPDPDASRFPEWERTSDVVSVPVPLSSITKMFEGWKREAIAANRTQKTINEYQSVITRFVAFLGHNDARRLSPTDVVGWKDKRLVDGIAARTIKDVDLSALKSVFGWAVRNLLLTSNPATGVTLKVGKKTQERLKGFTDEEARSILSAALRYKGTQHELPTTAAAKVWTPWLCAYTGARIGEMVQLRRQDVRHNGQHWVATITPEAGPVKTKERREVPLHPHLVELGFTTFVEQQPEGYLFGRTVGALQGVRNRVRQFVRTVVADKRVAPNHGWRHRFKTVGIDVGITDRVLDAICGHAARTAGERYGDVTLSAKADAIRRLPRYEPGVRRHCDP